MRTHIKRLKRGEEEANDDLPSEIRLLDATIKDKKYGLEEITGDDLPGIFSHRVWEGRIPLCPGLLHKP